MGNKKSTRKKNVTNADNTFELEFQIADLLDPHDEYELFILACFFALNDLTQIHSQIIKALKSNKLNGHIRYLVRISVGHLREAYWLIEKGFENDKIKSRLNEIHNAIALYEKICLRVNGHGQDNFVYRVLKPSRDLLFHYRFDQDDRTRFCKVFDDMKCESTPGTITFGTNNAKNYYEFADEYFFRILATNGQAYGLDLNSLWGEMGNLTAKFVELLDLITSDFLLSKPDLVEQMKSKSKKLSLK